MHSGECNYWVAVSSRQGRGHSGMWWLYSNDCGLTVVVAGWDGGVGVVWEICEA